MREYLDRVIIADKRAQYVDEIGIATHNAEELKTNLREVFQCVSETDFRLTTAKCQFGAKKVEFFGRTVSPERIAPPSTQNQSFCPKTVDSKNKEGSPEVHWICQLLSQLDSWKLGENCTFPRLGQS